MELDHFFGTIVLGKIFFPAHHKISNAISKECEDFIEKKSKILDLGCGRGILTNALGDYFQAEIVGVDIADQRIIRDFPFQLYDGKNLPFPDNSFDVVFLSYVLHHTEDLEKVISEIKRVTKKRVIVLEDLPEGIWGRFMSKIHQTAYSLIFKHKAFHRKTEKDWKKIFHILGLKTIFEKRVRKWIIWLFPLPQKRILFVLEKMGV